MEQSEYHDCDQNPESGTTTVNSTTTDDLEIASILAGLSSGMYI
jgi:hypothetical protein